MRVKIIKDFFEGGKFKQNEVYEVREFRSPTLLGKPDYQVISGSHSGNIIPYINCILCEGPDPKDKKIKSLEISRDKWELRCGQLEESNRKYQDRYAENEQRLEEAIDAVQQADRAYQQMEIERDALLQEREALKPVIPQEVATAIETLVACSYSPVGILLFAGSPEVDPLLKSEFQIIKGWCNKLTAAAERRNWDVLMLAMVHGYTVEQPKPIEEPILAAYRIFAADDYVAGMETLERVAIEADRKDLEDAMLAIRAGVATDDLPF